MLFSVHRAKTGGTSLTYAFQSCYESDELLSLGKQSLVPSNKKLLHLLLSNDRQSIYESFDKIRYVTGHYNNATLLWFTRNLDFLETFLLVRHPISLFWSSFYHLRLNLHTLTPEQHLYTSKSKGLGWFLQQKYGQVFPKNFFDRENPNFLKQFKYIFDTSNISHVLPQINPALTEFVAKPRRQMVDDPKKQRHPLQDCPDFKIKLESTLFKDIEYYDSVKNLIDSSQYINKNYDFKELKISIQKFRRNNSLFDVRNPFIKCLKNRIELDFKVKPTEKSLNSKKLKNIAKRQKEWKNALNNYCFDVDDAGNIYSCS